MNGHMPTTITCRHTTWLVSDARERALTADEAAALEHHRAGCPLCQGAAAQFAMLFRHVESYFGRRPPTPQQSERDDAVMAGL
jgi:hypothetical protein